MGRTKMKEGRREGKGISPNKHDINGSNPFLSCPSPPSHPYPYPSPLIPLTLTPSSFSYTFPVPLPPSFSYTFPLPLPLPPSLPPLPSSRWIAWLFHCCSGYIYNGEVLVIFFSTTDSTLLPPIHFSLALLPCDIYINCRISMVIQPTSLTLI